MIIPVWAFCAILALFIIVVLWIGSRLIAARQGGDAQLKALESRFAELAATQLAEKQQSLAGANAQNVRDLFTDLKEKLDSYKQAVESAGAKTQTSATSMAENVKSLQEFATQAHRFTAALLGGNKIQGNQGEQILANILDQSGFVLGREYDTQVGESTDGGRPDCCIYDALNKHVLFVDSKMDIKDFIDAYNMTDDTPDKREAKKSALRKHVASIKRQIDNLSGKNYAEMVKSPRDGFTNLPLVAMFCPFNAVLEAALVEDPKLMQYAFVKKVVLVTPTTLWGYLWLISYGWKREAAEKNVEEIQHLGGEVVEKIDALLQDVEDIAGQFDKVTKSFDSLRKHLGDKGQPSIKRVAQALLNSGASPKKVLKQVSSGESNE